ncbi:sigma-70 family RNA polymerase sigma factor [Mesorhizobium sp. M1428]|uniref:sigma-70 family RNA polymerase sigma factor n=1 Tax=unclassified Mesorhizobium TaxID=325217 RepID=UPI00333A0B27
MAQQATGELSIVEFIPALRAFARAFCQVREDADDLVQETLAKGLANIDKFEPGTRMKSWLFTIMRNTYYTRVRAATREAPSIVDCASLAPVSQPAQEWSMQSKEVHRATQSLPKSQSEVLMLVGVLGVSYEETAVICGCAVGTVKSGLSRARAGVLEFLGEKSAQELTERRDYLRDGRLATTMASNTLPASAGHAPLR